MEALFREQRSGGNALFDSVYWDASTAAPDLDLPIMIGSLSVSHVTTSSFNVDWQPATDNMAVVGYEVSVDTGTPSYVNFGVVLAASLANLLPATAYTVRVRAYDAANNKSVALTTQVTTATPIDLAVPVWPVSSVVSITAITNTGFTANWPAATDNVGVVSYEVSVDTGVPNFVTVGASRVKTAAGLLSGTTYNVRVRAVDGAGNVSLPIAAVAVTTGVAPLGEPVASITKLKDSASILPLSALSVAPVVIAYRDGAGQELVLFNNSDADVVAKLKGSTAGRVTTKGLAGVTIDLSGGLPITVPARQFVLLKLDNAVLYLKGVVTLTAAANGVVSAGLLQ